MSFTFVVGWLVGVSILLPLQPVYPSGGNGFAASIVGALMALALLAVVARFVASKPKNRRRPRSPETRPRNPNRPPS